MIFFSSELRRSFFLGREQKKCKIVQTMNKYVKHFSQTMKGLTEGKKNTEPYVKHFERSGPS